MAILPIEWGRLVVDVSTTRYADCVMCQLLAGRAFGTSWVVWADASDPSRVTRQGRAVAAVLVVEDDEGDALLVSESLFEAGFSRADVMWRRTLAEGIAALRQRPSCVLLDLGLPDAEGLGALHRLVERAAGVPVIVLTGRNDGTGDDAVAA